MWLVALGVASVVASVVLLIWWYYTCPINKHKNNEGDDCIWDSCPDINKQRDSTGECILIPCPDDFIRNAADECVYVSCRKKNMIRGTNGICITDPHPPVGPRILPDNGLQWNFDKLICKQGYKTEDNKVCRFRCLDSQKWENDTCVDK